MKQAEIKRVSFELPHECGESLVSLADEANEILGYSILKEHSEKTTDGMKPLERVLAELGIETLDGGDVENYQRKMLIDAANEKFAEWCKSNPTPKYGMFVGPSWTETKIEEYKQPIPEFVLNKAVQIKKAIPEAQIVISHLEMHPDPFLVVRLEERQYLYSESYFVECWEEPKFEGRIR